VIVPAVAVNVALLAPAPTVTDEGTVSSVLLSDTATAVPPAGAAPESVTVHVLLPDELRLAGEQLNDVSDTGTIRLIAAVRDTLPSVAVTVALPLDVIVPAVAVNVAVVAPAPTVTDEGTVSSVLLSDTATAVPPAGAAPESVTVHVLLPDELRLAGEQLSEVRLGPANPGPVIVPPAAVIVVALPEGKDATEATPNEVLSEDAATATLTTATTPFAIVVLFIPYSRHMCLPEVVEHWRVFPALEAAAPAVVEIETTLLAG